MITDIEQETTDIEWFFTNGDEIGFVASGGGKLPISISEKSFEELQLLADFFKGLPQNSNVIISHDLNKLVPSGTDIKEYIFPFLELAEKGIFSYDKTLLNNFLDKRYHLVAGPSIPLRLCDLPVEIGKVVKQTILEINMMAGFNI